MPTATEYAFWNTSPWPNKPNCWCFRRGCRGDINGTKAGSFWVSSADLTAFRAAFNKVNSVLSTITNGICADLNHAAAGSFRVSSADLTVFRAYFNKVESLVPQCDYDVVSPAQSGDGAGIYASWTN